MVSEPNIRLALLLRCFRVNAAMIVDLFGAPDGKGEYAYDSLNQKLREIAKPQTWQAPTITDLFAGPRLLDTNDIAKIAQRVNPSWQRRLGTMRLPYLDLGPNDPRFTVESVTRLLYPDFPWFTIKEVHRMLGATNVISSFTNFFGSNWEPFTHPQSKIRYIYYQDLVAFLRSRLQNVRPEVWICLVASDPRDPASLGAAAKHGMITTTTLRERSRTWPQVIDSHGSIYFLPSNVYGELR